MDKGGYTQPYMQDVIDKPITPADLDKWATANKDIWRLIKITGVPPSKAKEIILNSWDIAERTRFETWVSFYESEDDRKYSTAAYTDCDIESIKRAGGHMADHISGPRGERFKERIESAINVKTVVDVIRAMSSSSEMRKLASESDDDRSERMFNIIRDVQDELSKKKMVRNLARLFSMDRDGMFPEVPQALAKLIESYNYATTRIQDVMGRLGLQLSMSKPEERAVSEKENKLSNAVPEATARQPVKEAPAEVKKKEAPAEKAPAIVQERAQRPAATVEESQGVPMLPRVENRGI